MNFDLLIREVAKKTGFTIKDVTPVIKTTFDVIADTVVGGGEVKLQGFGNFTTTVRKPRMSVDPVTGAPIKLPESRNMKFTQSGVIKKAYRGE